MYTLTKVTVIRIATVTAARRRVAPNTVAVGVVVVVHPLPLLCHYSHGVDRGRVTYHLDHHRRLHRNNNNNRYGLTRWNDPVVLNSSNHPVTYNVEVRKTCPLQTFPRWKIHWTTAIRIVSMTAITVIIIIVTTITATIIIMTTTHSWMAHHPGSPPIAVTVTATVVIIHADCPRIILVK